MPYYPDVVVIGVSAPPSSAYDHMFGLSGLNYRFEQEQELSSDSGGGGDGGGDSDNFYDALKSFITDLLSKIFDKSLKTEQEVHDNETKIATQFDPSDAVAISHYTTQSGKTGTNWSMTDGTLYWDTNDNGKPDYHTKWATDGQLYGDDGSGWTLLH